MTRHPLLCCVYTHATDSLAARVPCCSCPASAPAVCVCVAVSVLPLQGDACALPPGLGTFDAVLAANLLCRVPDPLACLQGIADALNPGGVLVLTSPFTWMEDYTAKCKWLGGRVDEAGRELRCADALRAALTELGFTVLEEGKVGAVSVWGVNVGDGCVLCVGGGGGAGGRAPRALCDDDVILARSSNSSILAAAANDDRAWRVSRLAAVAVCTAGCLLEPHQLMISCPPACAAPLLLLLLLFSCRSRW
jgi:hypothetical protein